LLSLGTLSVSPVMARSGVAIASLSTHAFLADIPLTGSMSRDLANEELQGQGLLAKNPSSLRHEQELEDSYSIPIVLNQDEHDLSKANELSEPHTALVPSAKGGYLDKFDEDRKSVV